MRQDKLYWILLLLCPGLLFAQDSYEYSTIDYPGAVLTRTFDINDTGTVIGVFRMPGQPNHAFIVRDGKFTELPAPDPDTGYRAARGMNDRTDVVGPFTLNADDSEHGYLLRGRTKLRLDFPGAVATDPFGVNNRGSVVGSFVDGTGVIHGWLRRSGTYRQIDVPGALDSVPFGINDREQIVGGWDTAPNAVVFHGFLLERGKVVTYDVPVDIGSATQLNRINDIGDIVGLFQDNNGVAHGFILQGGLGGRFVQIDYPGATQTQVWGINNCGQLVGKYTDGSGVDHGFLATPANKCEPR